MKILSKLKESNSVDEDYINVRLTAFYAHICHSNARSLYRRIKKINNLQKKYMIFIFYGII